MTPDRLASCLTALRWSDVILAKALGCPLSRVEDWLSGDEPIPLKVAAWVETLAQVHEGLEPPPVPRRR